MGVFLSCNPGREALVISTDQETEAYSVSLSFQSRTGSFSHFDLCPNSTASEAKKASLFRDPPKNWYFWSRKCGQELSALLIKPLVECSENLRSETPSLRLSES